MGQILELKSLLDKALEAEYGICVEYYHSDLAFELRRRLYVLRNKLRREGHYQYDVLSMFVVGEKDLFIVNRASAAMKAKTDVQDCRDLSHNEIPKWRLRRGKSHD